MQVDETEGVRCWLEWPVRCITGNDSGPPSWQHRQAQHLLRHCGLPAVQATQKYSHVAVIKPAYLLTTSPSPFLYRRPWCINSIYPRHFYTEVLIFILTYRFLYILFCA